MQDEVLSALRAALRATSATDAAQLRLLFQSLSATGACDDAARAGEAAALVVATLTAHPDDLPLAYAGLAVFHVLPNGVRLAQTAVGLAGALPAVARVLQRHGRENKVVVAAAAVVVVLCDNHPANRDAAAACALVVLLCRGLAAHAQDEDTRRVVSNAIANAVSSHSRNAAAAAAAGGLETLAETLKVHGGTVPVADPEPQNCDTAASVYLVLLAAFNILEQVGDSMRAAFADAGGARAVMGAMAARPRNAHVQEFGCAALSALYAGDARALGASGAACRHVAVRAVLAAVRGACAATLATHPREFLDCVPGLLNYATGAMLRLVDKETPMREAAVKEGAVGTMLDTLKVLQARPEPDRPSIATQALAVLATVCRGNIDAADEAVRRRSLQIAVALMNTHRSSVPVQDEAINMIRVLASTARGGRGAAVAAGALPAVLAAMREHPTADYVQSFACLALTELLSLIPGGALNSAAAEAAVSSGAVELLCDVLAANFPETTQASENAVFGLGALLQRADAMEHALRRGAARLLREASLPGTLSTRQLRDKLVAALKHLAREHDARSTSCADDGCAHCSQLRAAGTLCAFPGCGVHKLPAPAAEAMLKKCAGCGAVRYCGADHQRAHWRVHKKDCLATRVAR